MSINSIISNVASAICITLVAVVMAIAPNLSASNHASVQLSGAVPEYMSLEMTSSDFDFGDPSQDSAHDALIGSIQISSNSPNGWALALSNSNDEFALQSGSDSIPYSLKYDGEKIKYGGSVSIDEDNGSNGATRGLKKDLKVTMKSDKELNSGNYTDELTLEITAN